MILSIRVGGYPRSYGPKVPIQPQAAGGYKKLAQRVFTEFDLSAGFDLQDYPPVKRWSDKNTQLRTRDLTLRNPPVSGGVIKSQFKPPSPSPHHNTTQHCGSPVKEAGYTQEEEEEEGARLSERISKG